MSTISRNLTTVDIAFAVQGTRPLPVDHGYLLYAAISRVLPLLHEPNGLAIHPIRGRVIGDRQMRLEDFSRLTIRVLSDRIGELLSLSGKQLSLAGRTLRVGIPEIRGLTAATSLRSRLVTIKISGGPNTESGTRSPVVSDQDVFLASARKQLETLGISSAAQLALGKRRTLRIKDKEVVGYEAIVNGLSAEDSLILQARGLGGRRHMGCGVFVPVLGNTERTHD